MKRMLVRLLCLALCLMMPAASLAEWPYLIRDSDVRELTWEESALLQKRAHSAVQNDSMRL